MGSRRKRTRSGKIRKWRTLPPGVRGVSMERPAPFVPSSPSRLPPPTSLLPLPVPLSVPLARVARLPHGENTQSMIIMHLSASAALPPRRGLTSSIHAPATAMSYDSTLLRALATGSPGQGAAHFSQTPPPRNPICPRGPGPTLGPLGVSFGLKRFPSWFRRTPTSREDCAGWPKTFQDDSRSASRGHNMSQWSSQEVPKEAPECSKHSFSFKWCSHALLLRMASGALQRTPRRPPKKGPKLPQDAPLGPRSGPREPLEGPREPQDGRRERQDGRRGPSKSPRIRQGGPRRPKNLPPEVPRSLQKATMCPPSPPPQKPARRPLAIPKAALRVPRKIPERPLHSKPAHVIFSIHPRRP